MAIYIYALIDPFTEEIRYIGKSVNPKARLQGHCTNPDGTYRSNWIQTIMAQGVKPNMRILEELPGGANWQDAERRWIAHGHANNWPLTNATSGGDGVPDLPPETRQRMAQAWMGRKHRPESLKKIGEASKGRLHSAEWKQNMSATMANRYFSPNHKEKISQGKRKLSNEQIEDVRKRSALGETRASLAREYGVDPKTILNIVENRMKYCQGFELEAA